MTPIRALPTTAALVIAAALAAAGQVPAPQVPSPQAPPFRSGINLVTVDVTVLARSGDPVTTLTLEDFTLQVDGSPRPIVSARLVESPAAPPSGTAAVPAPSGTPASDAVARRRFVLVVDRDHIPAGEGQQMLQAAATFIDSLPPGDGVALWTLPDSGTALRFGEDREETKRRLRMAVGTYRAPYSPWIIGRDEAIKADAGDKAVLESIIARECYKQPLEGCPIEVQSLVIQIAADARQRADATLAQLGTLVDALGQVEGPKHLVLVTGGPVFTLDNTSVITTLGTRAGLARVTIHALQVAEPSYQARTDRMRAMPAEINQTASAAYMLAGTTGGLAITPTSGEIGFSRLAQDLSAGYLLVFETQPSDRDGRTHEISVKVKDAGWGGVVRARKFFRVNPNAAANPVPGPAPAAVAAPVPPPEPVGVNPGDMAERLADYAEAFEREFAAVVAEERYVQVIHPWRGNPSGPKGEPASSGANPAGRQGRAAR